MNGYICFFSNKKIEIYANDLYDAKQKAVKFFKVSKKDEYKVGVYLAEKAGEQVVQTADF